MTNLEMIKTMTIGMSWIFNPNVDGNDILFAVQRHATGFQIRHMGSDRRLIYKWLQEEYKEQKGE